MTAKDFWKKLWFTIWKDNSPKGWFLSILFIFIVIKFIFFPLMSFATGTELPLAIVESCSMHHKGNFLSSFDPWFERHEAKYSNIGIDKELFSIFPMKRGFTKGDILLITRADPDKLEIGDIIIFNAGQRNPIIHRIVNIRTDSQGKRIFSTMGDNNDGQLAVEKSITEEMLVGKAKTKIAPYFGWVKLIFFEWQKPIGEKGFCNEN